MNDQLNEISTTLARIHQTTPVGLSGQFYYLLMGKISHFGLYKLQKQYALYRQQARREAEGERSDESICTSNFNKSMGMPCWHIIKDRLAQNQGIFDCKFKDKLANFT